MIKIDKVKNETAVFNNASCISAPAVETFDNMSFKGHKTNI